MFSSNTSQVFDSNYIEDVFSTWLYTGTSATRTITNNINLSTNGGLVWTKRRDTAGYGNNFIDTVRGATKVLDSAATAAETTYADSLTAFTTTGYTLGADALNGGFNSSSGTYVGWSFRRQAKFFDVVTYTGDGVAGRTVAHNLGSVPGCIFIKRTDSTANWQVYHRSLANTQYLVLNATSAVATGATRWNSTTPTSTVFTLGTDATVNGNGFTYVAYLFAHDAGGFGTYGSDNVISCGTFTTNASGLATVTLGYEPQLVIAKSTSAIGEWKMIDVMRGWAVTNSNNSLLRPNTTAAEVNAQPDLGSPTSTGIAVSGLSASTTYVYITIRRGPMRTQGSSINVFGVATPIGAAWTVVTSNGGLLASPTNAIDAVLVKSRTTVDDWTLTPRLTGFTPTSSTVSTSLSTNTTAAESVKVGGVRGDAIVPSSGLAVKTVSSSGSGISYQFSRAPGFLDVVCRVGTGAVQATVSHNLTVPPELIIGKVRSNIRDWVVYFGQTNKYLNLNSNSAQLTDASFMTSVSSTNFVTGTSGLFNEAAENFVYYLFATATGISKVGSYTGTGTTLQVNCDFSSGARFVLIKRIDSTGDWYVWDSTRGIIAANDPYLLINSSAVEVTSTDYIDTYAAGFEISSTAPAAINASGGSFIFFAIA